MTHNVKSVSEKKYPYICQPEKTPSLQLVPIKVPIPYLKSRPQLSKYILKEHFHIHSNPHVLMMECK